MFDNQFRQIVSWKEWKRSKAALEVILRWCPEWRPNSPSEVYIKLDQLGLLDDFLKRYSEKESKGKNIEKRL